MVIGILLRRCNVVNYKKDRQDLGYLPSDGEDMRAYLERLQNVMQQTRYAYAPKHEDWYTHYGPFPCWICNLLDMCDYLNGIMKDILNEDKLHRWKCVKPTGSVDPLTFTFKPHKV